MAGYSSVNVERLILERDAAVAERDAAIAERDAALARIVTLERQVEMLMSRLAELEARLKTNSSNSSKPPSSDMHGRKHRPRNKSNNKAGGQEGHEGKTFQPFAAEQVSQIQLLKPSACGKCGTTIDSDAVVHGEPVTWQTVELPPVTPLVIEYQRYAVCCAGCGAKTRGSLPEGVGSSPYGPRLCALVTGWAFKFHLSRRQIQALLHSQYGLKISVGAIQAIIERVATACAPVVEELCVAVQNAAVVNADETGAAHQGGGAKKKRHWLWVGVTLFYAVYMVSGNRGTDALAKLLGKDFGGIVVCDRWRPYESLFGKNRQLCWAHIAREGQSAIDRAEPRLKSIDEAVKASGESLLAWGQTFLEHYENMFDTWYRFKRGEIARQQLIVAMAPHQTAIQDHLTTGLSLSDKKVATTCKDLLRQWDVLWTFVTIEDVEPTNNAAERAMRQPVMLRKKSQGTRSEEGKEALGILLSVTETCRRQAISVIDYLESVCKNVRLGLPPPSLLPC